MTDSEALRLHVCTWLKQHPLSPVHVDCATTVMLKILDGKCKMSPEEKTLMAELYAQVKDCPGKLFGAEIHALIANAMLPLSDEKKMQIYEQRLLAEIRLSRPVMKEFKTMIRAHGIFEEQL